MWQACTIKFDPGVVDVVRMQITAPMPVRAAAPASAPNNVPSPPLRRVEIAAHRGYHDGTAPYENTMEAFRRAIEVGADLVETDIHRTADGVLVLYHDASIDGHAIAKTRYADLPLLPTGERMATLEQLIDLKVRSGGATKLLLETKKEGYEAQVVELVRARLQPSQYELMSFDLDSVRALRELAPPEAKVGVLFGLMPDWKTGTWPISGAAMVDKARKLGVDFVAIDKLMASDDRIGALAAAGFDVAIWTVDKQSHLEKFLRDPRVSRIITDRPDLALDLRDRTRLAA